jgi:hypothetical protein
MCFPNRSSNQPNQGLDEIRASRKARNLSDRRDNLEPIGKSPLKALNKMLVSGPHEKSYFYRIIQAQ